MQFLLLRDLAIIFAGSLLVILVFHRLKLPALPGFIVAGVLLGPNALGLVSDVHQVESLAEVGVILLLFTIGIEFSLSRAAGNGSPGGDRWRRAGAAHRGVERRPRGRARPRVAGRRACGVSRRAVEHRHRAEGTRRQGRDRHAARSPGDGHAHLPGPVRRADDARPALSGRRFRRRRGRGMGPHQSRSRGRGRARAGAHRRAAGAERDRQDTQPGVVPDPVILVGTLTALGTAAAGASLALGAFLAGLVISESDYGHQAMAELLPFRDVFISLFFVAVGMLVQVAFLRDHPLLAVAGVAAIMGGKSALAALGPAVLGYSGRVALLAGLAVSQIGEFSFVLARQGRGTALLSEALYQTFLAVAVLTMLVTPFLLEAGPALVDRLKRIVPLDRLLPGFRPQSIEAGDQPLTDHVVIAGYGLNGRNLAAALRAIRAPYLIVELNSQTVRQAR